MKRTSSHRRSARRTRAILTLVPLLLVAGACASSKHKTPTALQPTPTATTSAFEPPAPAPIPTAAIVPANFVRGVSNPFYPLAPGSKWVYTGSSEDGPVRETFQVTAATKKILGVSCVVVSDQLTVDGAVKERVDHFYAQDVDGNVWYFGEADDVYEKGKVVSHEGSWQTGLYGARAGIVMAGRPRVGDTFRIEYYKGHVEDNFIYFSLDATVTIPAGTYTSVVQTKEWTRLEVGAIDSKYYARGVGLVKEQSDAGSDHLDLMSFSK